MPFLDFFNLIAYDYTGNFSRVSGHQANLYHSNKTPLATPFSTDVAIKDYLKFGVPANMINLGMPLYGHGFQHTNGIGQPFIGVGKGSFEPGIWDYKALPQAGAVVRFDEAAGASYSWDETERIIVSYDTLGSSDLKIQYIKDQRLGGAMFWELSGDKLGNESLVGNVGGLSRVMKSLMLSFETGFSSMAAEYYGSEL